MSLVIALDEIEHFLLIGAEIESINGLEEHLLVHHFGIEFLEYFGPVVIKAELADDVPALTGSELRVARKPVDHFHPPVVETQFLLCVTIVFEIRLVHYATVGITVEAVVEMAVCDVDTLYASSAVSDSVLIERSA